MAGIEGAISGIFGLANTVLNNELIGARTSQDRAENYLYGERAANNADKRTRALYADFYSPEALMNQYQEAGLSPSLMFGGTPGQGGMSGAQGTGAAGPQTPYMPFSILEAAQAAQLFAQTEKTKEETKNIATDTKLKALQSDWQDMLNKEHSVEFKLTTTYLFNKETGVTTSFYELANECNNYDQFLQKSRELAKTAGNNEIDLMIGTEAGQKTMREIFLNANRFDRDIKVLSAEGVSADFQEGIMKCLKQEGFAQQNAKTAIKQLQAASEAADLTKEQKGAWNNIISRLQKTNGTMADIVIICSMILGQAMGKVNFSLGAKLGGE